MTHIDPMDEARKRERAEHIARAKHLVEKTGLKCVGRIGDIPVLAGRPYGEAARKHIRQINRSFDDQARIDAVADLLKTSRAVRALLRLDVGKAKGSRLVEDFAARIAAVEAAFGIDYSFAEPDPEPPQDDGPAGVCKKCGTETTGEFELCDDCGSEEFEKYDYDADDRNFDAARERGR